MSDAASPQNLGLAFFLAHSTKVYGDNNQVAAENWNEDLDDVDRQEWVEAAEDFCKYLKYAESDS